MNLRTWLAVGVLSVSWLPGLEYYAPAGPWTWGLMVLLGAVLLLGREITLPERRDGAVAAVLMLPVIWFMPWPFKAAALLLTIALALSAAPIPRGWPRRVATPCLAAGGVLLAQAVAIYSYAAITARSHDLPGPLATLVGWAARLVGADVATSGSTLTMRAAETTDRLGATWDLLLPPTLVCLVVGAAVMVGLSIPGRPQRIRRWLRAMCVVALVVAVWLPLRLVIVLGLYTQRAALAPSGIPPMVMNQMLVWWLPAMLLAVPVLLCWWFVVIREPKAVEDEAEAPAVEAVAQPTARGLLVAVLLAAIGAALVTFPWAWDPIGSPAKGQVRIAERCSEWEPTDAAYDEQHYGELASYTYRVIYDYASHRFTMSRLGRQTPISADSLAECDVLVLKTPTARMSPAEVEAIVDFVEHGGGLLLIGDHTNVFRSSTYLNDVARRFGFTFRNDLLFNVGDAYRQSLPQPAAPHPATMHVGDMDFAVSCSIDPGTSWGRSAITGKGLWSLDSEYQNSNYHPPSEYRPEMRTGPFVQLWAARYGKGRVLAFTDSTIFSNFCTFQPGKAELFLNMLTWLNHRSPLDERFTWAVVVIPIGLVGALLLGVAVLMGRKRQGGWALVLAAGLCGAVLCCMVIATMAAAAMPVPAVENPPCEVVIDRTASEAPLSIGPDTQGDGMGFGLFEQWIPRLNRPANADSEPATRLLYTSRRAGDEAFSGDVLVVICPTGSVTDEYREKLIEFVRDGGRLLVLDSADNPRSTANSLLWPFGLAMDLGPARQGPLVIAGRPMGVDLTRARAVRGGTPIAEIVQQASSSQSPPGVAPPVNLPRPGEVRLPVGAQVGYGEGSVTAVGFASAVNDTAMGGHWMPQPNDDARRRYEIVYALLRQVLLDRPVEQPQAAPGADSPR